MSLYVSQLTAIADVNLRRRVRRIVDKVVHAARLDDVINVSLSFVDDDEMAELNGNWRGKPVPTDVLSFAAFDGEPMPGMENELGDIVISIERAQAQAQACGHSVEVEVAVLLTHGLLHLLDVDHERSTEEAMHMAECEMTWLAAAGVDPAAALIGRAFG